LVMLNVNKILGEIIDRHPPATPSFSSSISRTLLEPVTILRTSFAQSNNFILIKSNWC
jgi:hypothetical protein